MSILKNYSWKILAVGRNGAIQIENHLHQIGYKNVKVIGIDNDKASDNKLIDLLKKDDWDGVSIGGGVNGYVEGSSREATTLHWFNRIVNLVHEHAPKAKLIFVTYPDDLINSFERVLGS